MKKKTITVRDRRSESYDEHNPTHRNEKLFTVLSMKNTTRYRIDEMISDNEIMRLNIESDWEVNIVS